MLEVEAARPSRRAQCQGTIGIQQVSSAKRVTQIPLNIVQDADAAPRDSVLRGLVTEHIVAIEKGRVAVLQVQVGADQDALLGEFALVGLDGEQAHAKTREFFDQIDRKHEEALGSSALFVGGQLVELGDGCEHLAPAIHQGPSMREGKQIGTVVCPGVAVATQAAARVGEGAEKRSPRTVDGEMEVRSLVHYTRLHGIPCGIGIFEPVWWGKLINDDFLEPLSKLRHGDGVHLVFFPRGRAHESRLETRQLDVEHAIREWCEGVGG